MDVKIERLLTNKNVKVKCPFAQKSLEIGLSVCLPIYPSVFLSVNITIRLFMRLFICCLFICLFYMLTWFYAYSSVLLSICLSVHSICKSVYMYICKLSICSSVSCLSIYLSWCPFVFISECFYICHLSVCQCVGLFICLYITFSVYLSAHLFECPYVHKSSCLFIFPSVSGKKLEKFYKNNSKYFVP